MNIGYRLRIFDGPLYYTGSTVLTPAPGAIHTDPFAITTLSSGSLSGYAPYMRPPRGNRGQLDVRTGRSTVGTYTVDVLDKRTATSNANRWVTAFIGDNNSKLTIIGKKAVIEETVDGGSNWKPFFIGRVNSFNLTSPLVYSIEIGDPLELLKQKIFEIEPGVSYTSFKSLLPTGYTKPVTNLDSGSSIQLTTGLNVAQVRSSGATANDRWLKFDQASVNRNDNAWSYGVISPAAIGNVFNVLAGQNPFRCLILSGSTYRTYQVRTLQTPAKTNSELTVQPIEQINIIALPTNDPLYSPITDIKTTDVNLKVWVYRLLDESEDKLGIFYLNETPYNILRDIMDGKFFNRGLELQSGSTTVYIDNSVKIPYDSASIASMESINPLPKMLYKIEQPETAVDFIEKHICQPFSLGYTFIPTASGANIYNAFKLFSTKQPTTTSSVTYDNTNIISSDRNDWSSNEPLLFVKGTFYVENLVGGRFAVRRTGTTGDSANNPIQTIIGQTLVGLTEATDSSYKGMEVDMIGLRGVNNSLLTLGQGTMENVPAFQYTQGKALRYIQDIYNRHKAGNPAVNISIARSGSGITVVEPNIGDFVLVSEDVLPNQATHVRGGSRIYQVISKNDVGASIDLSLLDSGINATMNQPSFGAVTSPSLNIISSSITTTDDALVEVEYAAVSSGSTLPASTSNSWLMYQAIAISASTYQLQIPSMPEGRTIYLRARSVTPDAGNLKLPSSYVYSSGSTLNNIPAVAGVTVTNITDRSARVNWTSTSDFYPIEVLLASPTGTPNTSLTVLPPSSSIYQLTGLNLNTSPSHSVGIRYVDDVRGFGPITTASFVATGTATTLDAPAALILYVAR